MKLDHTSGARSLRLPHTLLAINLVVALSALAHVAAVALGLVADDHGECHVRAVGHPLATLCLHFLTGFTRQDCYEYQLR